MDSGEVVFLYQPPTPDSESTSNLRGVLVPPSGCVIVMVPCGFLPLWYAFDWDGSFIPPPNTGEPVTLKTLKELDEFCGIHDLTEGVYILVSFKELAGFGVKIEDGPGFGWNEYAGKFYEDEQPSPTSVWNPGCKRWDEPCNNESCICGGKKLNIDWRDTNFASLLEHDYFSFRSFFDTDLGGLYCSETCKCNGCNKYYNPTNEDAKKRHELLDPDGWVRGCTKLGDSSDLYKY